jgi:NAD(P)-dependent dehydrogenase (short-subunit alcohol dehydrogenase family)
MATDGVAVRSSAIDMEPSDVLNDVLFLASDEAHYITDVALPIDAGSVIR